MSYCRSGWDSDVYVLKSITGEWVCWAEHGEFATRNPSMLFIHLIAHKEEGDKVPDRVFDRLTEDIKEHTWMGSIGLTSQSSSRSSRSVR